MNSDEDQELLRRVRESDLAGCNFTHLSLKSRVVGDEGATRIADALAENRTIKKLSLDGNSIGVPGIAKLAKSLSTNRYICSLNLRGNPAINNDAATYLSRALKKNEILSSLNIGYCSISDAGAKSIAASLSEGNSTLVRLYVASNNIGDEGVSALSKSISTHNLSFLDLRRNSSITAVGAAELGFYLGLMKEPLREGVRYGKPWNDANQILKELRKKILTCSDISESKKIKNLNNRRVRKKKVWRFEDLENV